MDYTENLKLDKPGEYAFDWQTSWYKNQTVIDLTINQMLKDNWTLVGGAFTITSGLACSLGDSSFSIAGETFPVTAETVNITGAGAGLINITFVYVDDTGNVIQALIPPTGNYALIAIVLNNDTSIISITNLNRYKQTVSAGIKENLSIDGDFNLWFEADSQTTSGYGSDTMFFNGSTVSTKTHQKESFPYGQVDVPGNPKYFSRTIITSAFVTNAICYKDERFENILRFSGQKVTRSFWAKANNELKSISIEPICDFGTSGTPSANVLLTPLKISLSTVWTKYHVTFDIPNFSDKVLGTDGNDNLKLRIWFDAGSTYNARTDTLGNQSGTFDLAKMRLVFGNEPAGEELLNLAKTQDEVETVYQRGMYVFESGSLGTTYFYERVALKRNMNRVNPSVIYADLAGNISKISEKRGSVNTNNVTPAVTAPSFGIYNGMHFMQFMHRNTTSAISGVGFRYTFDCRL